VAKPWPSFVVDTHMREKNPFLDFFVALSQSFSKTFSEFCVYITKRKSEKSLDESFEFARKFVFVDDFVRKFVFATIWHRKRNLSYYSFSIFALFFFYSFAS
jgi:hypothetical protein